MLPATAVVLQWPLPVHAVNQACILGAGDISVDLSLISVKKKKKVQILKFNAHFWLSPILVVLVQLASCVIESQSVLFHLSVAGWISSNLEKKPYSRS